MSQLPRRVEKSRKTTETNVSLALNLDGEGVSHIETGIPFFDHMLTLFSRHSLGSLFLRHSVLSLRPLFSLYPSPLFSFFPSPSPSLPSPLSLLTHSLCVFLTLAFLLTGFLFGRR